MSSSEKSENQLLPVTRHFQAGTYDIDFAGHVSNIVYIRWLEDLRTAWLDEYYPLQEQMEQGLAPVLLRTEIDYIKQIKLFDRPVVGTVWVEQTGKVRANLGFAFHVGDTLMAQARQVGIWFYPATGRPARIPAPLRDLIKQQSENCEDETP